MTRMLGMFTAGLAVVVVATPGAKAGGYYFGVQFGHQPRAHAHHQRAYSAPATYGYAPAAGYAPMVMMAPAAGCSGAGFAPMMAPSGGCYGSGVAYGYAAPGYGYTAPGYGYGCAAPQSGVLSMIGGAGGIVETIRALKEIRDTFDDLRGGGKQDTATKEELAKLRTEVEGIRKDITLLNVPANLDLRLEAIRNEQQKMSLELQTLRRDVEALKKK